MRVLELSRLYPVPYNPGLGVAMHKQITALAEKGCEIKVVSPYPWVPFPLKHLSSEWRGYSEVPFRDVVGNIQVFHPRYISFPRGLWLSSSGIRMYWGIRRLVKKIRGEFHFDLIHAHMAMSDGYAGMLLKQIFGTPLVLTPQATDIDITANRTAHCLQALHKVFAEADMVIAPSPRLGEVLRSRFEVEPVEIGYGVDPGAAYLGYSNLREKYETRRILLSVSQLIPSKGVDITLHALKRLMEIYDNITCLVVGSGPSRQALDYLVKKLGLADHVEFIGQLPYREVMEYMSICDIFVLPSWQETFGLVYIEAMMHGKPTVGCKGQGVDGIIIENDTGLLSQPKDVESLVKAIDYLLSNPDKAKAIGERAKKLVLENYTWERNAEKTIQVYKEVIGVR